MKSKSNPLVTTLMHVALLASTVACATQAAVVKPTQALNMAVRVESDANGGFPAAISVVLVYGQMALTKIKAMPARQYFDERKQMKRDFPECSGFVAFDWEWVPGRYVSPITIMVPPQVIEVYMFANYLSKGDHRVAINVVKGVNLKLLKEEAEAAPLVDQLLRKHTTDPRRRVYSRGCDEPDDGDPTKPAPTSVEALSAQPGPEGKDAAPAP